MDQNYFRRALTVALLSTTALVFLDCEKEEMLGYDQAINPIWERNFKVGYSASMIPLIHNDIVVFSSYKEFTSDFSSNDKLLAYNKKSGDTEWEWSDLFEHRYEQIDKQSNKIIYDNTLVFAIGSRNYAINLNNGTTSWRNRTTPSYSQLSYSESKIYRIDMYKPDDGESYRNQVMEADVRDGNWTQIFEVNGGDSLSQGLTPPVTYINPDVDKIMVMSNNIIDEREESEHYVRPYLISYNRTQNKINYQVLLDEPGLYSIADWYPIIYNEMIIVLVGSLMTCHDLKTGELIWQKRFDGNFVFSGAIIQDNCIYANQDGVDPTLYCINVSNGTTIWKTRSAGTSSPLQYHENVLYFIGGSTGLLHVVNATTGEHICKIKAPSAYSDSDDFFSSSSGCTIDPKTNRIYVSSYTRAYCYPTVDLK